MKKHSALHPFIVLIIASLLFFSSCKSSIKEPDFLGAKNFNIGKIGLQESSLGVELYYYNPNSFNMELKKADLEIYFENRYLGQTHLDTLLQIPAKDTFYIPVKLAVNMKNLFPNLLSLALKDEVEVKMTGSAKVSRAGFTMNIPVNYAGKHKIIF